MNKNILIIGSGKGISKAVAKRFGKEGYHVILVSRSKDKLEDITNELAKQQISVQYFVADAKDTDSMKDVFEQIWENIGFIDTLLYNVSKSKQVNIAEETADSLTKDFKSNVAAALTAIQLVLPDMEKNNTGTILLTGGGLALHPNPEYGSLSLGKAALRNMSESLHYALKPKNIFVGTVTVCGFVHDDDKKYNANQVAEQFWKLNTDRNQFEIQY